MIGPSQPVMRFVFSPLPLSLHKTGSKVRQIGARVLRTASASVAFDLIMCGPEDSSYVMQVDVEQRLVWGGRSRLDTYAASGWRRQTEIS